MAGDWIKFELATLDKPEVCQLADLANIDMDAVVGKLLRVWGWFDQHTEAGNAPSVSKRLLDRLVGVTGFCDSMKSVGWMFEEEGVISLPRFERHNGKTAKNRLLTAKRVANHKSANAKGNGKGNGAIVSDALPKEDVEKKEQEQEQEPPFPPSAEVPPAEAPELQLTPDPVQHNRRTRKPNPKFDPLSACPPNVSPEVWAKWVKHRKELGKSLKETTCEAQVKLLTDHSSPDAVIAKSIANGWTGLFPEGVGAPTGNVHQFPNTKAAPSRHHGFDDRDYFDGLTLREDGTHGL